MTTVTWIFLSTLSLRRATRVSCISIHALLAESDIWLVVNPPRHFLSTLSLRRATANIFALNKPFWISIHALLAESDAPRDAKGPWVIIFYFYPRSLRRATHNATSSPDILFLSQYEDFVHMQQDITESGDFDTLSLRRDPHFKSSWPQNFYPRSPCGERPDTTSAKSQGRLSIHALLAESDHRHQKRNGFF